MSAESLESLKKLEYPVKIHFDPEDNIYVAEYFDLPGCSAYGDSVEEAYALAKEAKDDWLRLSLEEGIPIPKPANADDYNGRILARVPSSLHAQLTEQAKLHGTSLNQYIVHLLSSAVVGDGVGAQIDQLRSKVSQLEWQIAQVMNSLKAVYPQPIQRPAFPSTANVFAGTITAVTANTVSGLDTLGGLEQTAMLSGNYSKVFLGQSGVMIMDVTSTNIPTPTQLPVSNRKQTARTR
jgi:antitoxin HicB